MKMKMLSLGGALALCIMALATTAEAARYDCDAAKKSCLTGCPCALFECYPSQGYSICSCPIWCPDEA